MIDREALIKESKELENRMKSASFVNPRDMRRYEEILSLLLSEGKQTNLELKSGKLKESKRVTSFTRNRR
jgi:hypothetical protein